LCRAANAAIEVSSAANLKMQGASVSAGTGPAYRVRDMKSRLHLVSCKASVTPHHHHASQPYTHINGKQAADDGSRDSVRVYMRSGGGQIRAVDCTPELDPKPKVRTLGLPSFACCSDWSPMQQNASLFAAISLACFASAAGLCYHPRDRPAYQVSRGAAKRVWSIICSI
jgi:hypothetical protein